MELFPRAPVEHKLLNLMNPLIHGWTEKTKGGFYAAEYYKSSFPFLPISA